MNAKTIHEIRRQLRHFEALESLGFNGDIAALARLENEAHRAAENYCNLPNYDWEKKTASIEKRVAKLFSGILPNGFFINGDPRGYALKIRVDVHLPAGLHTDFGGYGILAPESF